MHWTECFFSENISLAALWKVFSALILKYPSVHWILTTFQIRDASEESYQRAVGEAADLIEVAGCSSLAGSFNKRETLLAAVSILLVLERNAVVYNSECYLSWLYKLYKTCGPFDLQIQILCPWISWRLSIRYHTNAYLLRPFQWTKN